MCASVLPLQTEPLIMLAESNPEYVADKLIYSAEDNICRDYHERGFDISDELRLK